MPCVPIETGHQTRDHDPEPNLFGRILASQIRNCLPKPKLEDLLNKFRSENGIKNLYFIVLKYLATFDALSDSNLKMMSFFWMRKLPLPTCQMPKANRRHA
jgi:hypothetical protein